MNLPKGLPLLLGTISIFVVAAHLSKAGGQQENFGEAIEISTTDGDEHRIPVLGKTATVLVFLSSDCPIANKYAPELRRIQERFEDKGVAFLRVYGDTYHDVDEIRKHTEKYEYTMPAILDAEQVIVKRTGATVTPEAVVLNEDGGIVYRGRIDDRYADFRRYRQHAQQHDLIDALTATLAGESPPNPRTKAIGCFIPRPRNTPAPNE